MSTPFAIALVAGLISFCSADAAFELDALETGCPLPDRTERPATRPQPPLCPVRAGPCSTTCPSACTNCATTA